MLLSDLHGKEIKEVLSEVILNMKVCRDMIPTMPGLEEALCAKEVIHDKHAAQVSTRGIHL